MFETLPVVIPTLRDVARGTLRPPTPANAHDAGPRTPTAAILLDAAAPDAAAVRTLYEELELYLQAASIATLRLHRRQRSSLAQMLDILAAVTLLRSQGYQRVILIVAAEGVIPRWERSRGETLAGMLAIVRRHHSGSAVELIGAIEDLVTSIRTVADSVIGVATILVRTPGLTSTRAAKIEAASRPNRPGSRRSLVRARAISPRAVSPPPSSSSSSSSSSSPTGSPEALAISFGAGESAVDAVAQLYLWCRALANQTPCPSPAPAPRMVEHSTLARLQASSAEFHSALRWLDEQWSALVGDLARQTPQSATRILATAARRSRPAANQAHASLTSRAAWRYLDTSTRLRWLSMCQRAFMSLRQGTSSMIERVD